MYPCWCRRKNYFEKTKNKRTPHKGPAGLEKIYYPVTVTGSVIKNFTRYLIFALCLSQGTSY